MPTTHLLYLHGFRSSPQSTKARKVQQRIASRHPGVQLWCPQLPPSPAEAMTLVLQGTANWPHARMAVIGSSLGGFYAQQVAERTGCRAAVINPAVAPARDLARHVGTQSTWHDPSDGFVFEPRYLDELQALHIQAITRPERYYALIARGDEVLDWQEMHHHFAPATCHILPGSDHAVSDFDDHMDALLAFLDLAT